MPIALNASQLVLALAIGGFCAVRTQRSAVEAAVLGAKVAFVLGAAGMLFSETRWWPAGWTTLALVFWVAAGALAAFVGHEATRRGEAALRRLHSAVCASRGEPR